MAYRYRAYVRFVGPEPKPASPHLVMAATLPQFSRPKAAGVRKDVLDTLRDDLDILPDVRLAMFSLSGASSLSRSLRRHRANAISRRSSYR